MSQVEAYDGSKDLLFSKLRIDNEWLLPSNTPPVGFGGTKVFPIETITLLVTIGPYPQQLTREITFLVVNCFSAYNAIIRWSTLNTWRATTSMHHLLVKFSTKYKIGEAH